MWSDCHQSHPNRINMTDRDTSSLPSGIVIIVLCLPFALCHTSKVSDQCTKGDRTSVHRILLELRTIWILEFRGFY